MIAGGVLCSTAISQSAAQNQKVRPVFLTKSRYAVADALASRPDTTLVAGTQMLRVLHPTLGAKRQTFVLDSCPSSHDAVLQKLQNKSIAVMAHLEPKAGNHQCTLEQIVAAYGRPNASTTLSGSLAEPREVILYYDKGPQQSGPIKPISPPQAPATVVPMTLSTLPAATCPGKTLLNVVAHEDDDLLFMNPDLQHRLRGGDCLRTVYLTAGDDGMRSNYWLGREKGAEAAYDVMAGHGASLWLERNITVNGHEYIKMASPRGNARITLIFVHLPDGNVPGGGFARTHYESLAKLANGNIAVAHTVDGQSSYSKSDLTDLLVRLLQYYHPDQIDTQTPLNASGTVAQEHSDHMTAGQFTAAAYGIYAQRVALRYYTGYPISLLPQNISSQDQSDKTAAFYAYVPHDSQVCLNPADCAPTGPYASWLARQYTYTPGDALIGAPAVPTPPPPTPLTNDDTSAISPTPGV
jgi:LmbE family N-acetylglucosaminyl deacetylase